MKEILTNFAKIQYRFCQLRTRGYARARQYGACHLILRILADLVDVHPGSYSVAILSRALSKFEPSSYSESRDPAVGYGRGIQVGGIRSGRGLRSSVDFALDIIRG
jgi:hypothetical protein